MSDLEKTSREFTCKCKETKSWIYHGQITEPCPKCGRKYKGVEKTKRGLTDIEAVEL